MNWPEAIYCCVATVAICAFGAVAVAVTALMRPDSAEPPTNQAQRADAAQVDGKVPGTNLKDQSQ